MRRMAYHLLAVLILAMTASTIKAQILLVTSVHRSKNMRQQSFNDITISCPGGYYLSDMERCRTGKRNLCLQDWIIR